MPHQLGAGVASEHYPQTSCNEWCGANLQQHVNWQIQSATSIGAGRCRRTRSTRPFIALSEKSKLIDTRGANLIHDGHHVTIFGACIALEVDPLVQLIGKAVFHL